LCIAFFDLGISFRLVGDIRDGLFRYRFRPIKLVEEEGNSKVDIEDEPVPDYQVLRQPMPHRRLELLF
jgi:hypothetical protein